MERVLDGAVKIPETPGSRRIRYEFRIPDNLDEPYSDLTIVTDGGCNSPDIRRLKIELNAGSGFEDITDDCITDPENGNDSTRYKVVFPDQLTSGNRLRVTILFDEEFDTGEYVVFRPSFDDGSTLASTQFAAPSTGELALAVFKRQARAQVAAEILAGRSASTATDLAFSRMAKRLGFRGTLEKLAETSPDFDQLLAHLDAAGKAVPVKPPKTGGTKTTGKMPGKGTRK